MSWNGGVDKMEHKDKTAVDKYEELKELLEQHRSLDNAESMAAYMKHHFVFYGISTVERRKLIRPFLKEEKKQGGIDWELLDACFQDDHREMQYIGIDILNAMQKWLRYEDIALIEPYLRTKQWWDSIDEFDTLIGDIGLSDQRVDGLMLTWSKDDDFWMNRLAIDHQLTRKEKTNTKLLKAILLNNLGSKEFFVNKAIGWSLREYSKTNPTWVYEFIEQYKADMHPLSIREASKYLG